MTLANCNPSPVTKSKLPARTIGKRPGKILVSMTMKDRNARPINAATKTISMVSPRLSLSIMIALLRAAITDRPVTAMV